MKTFLACLALVALVPGQIHAQCTSEAARVLSERYMGALLASDCEVRLASLSAPESWLRECRRSLKSPSSALKIEFAQRTSFRYTQLMQTGSDWMAAGILRGPSPAAFNSVLTRNTFCEASWTSYRPKEQECSADLSAIPVEEYEGGVPLVCEGERWTVGQLE
jgi:hypothetical protein